MLSWEYNDKRKVIKEVLGVIKQRCGGHTVGGAFRHKSVLLPLPLLRSRGQHRVRLSPWGIFYSSPRLLTGLWEFLEGPERGQTLLYLRDLTSPAFSFLSPYFHTLNTLSNIFNTVIKAHYIENNPFLHALK